MGACLRCIHLVQRVDRNTLFAYGGYMKSPGRLFKKLEFMQKIVEYLLLVKTEAMKINWPTREQVVRYTMIVLGVSAFVAVLLGTLDSFFGMLFQKIILGE